MSIKVLLINQHFYPEIAATAQLLTDLAEDLTKAGIEVRVLAGRPSYLASRESESRESLEPTSNFASKELYHGIEICRVLNTRFSRKSWAGRFANWISFYFLAFLRALWLPRPDLVVCLSTPPLISLTGLLLKRLKGCKFLFWCQDLYPDIALALGMLRPGGVARVSEGISRAIYREADGIVVVSEGMKRGLLAKGVKEEQIDVIHNWADGQEIYPLEPGANPFRQEVLPDGRFVVSYSGNMGHSHDFSAILNAMERVRNKEGIRFLIIGDGIGKRNIEEFIAEKDLHNVILLPFQPRERLCQILNAADVSLVSLRPEAEGQVMPSKLYGYMAAGKPIIAVASEGSEAARMVKACGMGAVAENGEELEEAIMKLYREPDLRARMGSSARRAFLENFDRPLATGRFKALIEEVMGREVYKKP